MNYTVILFEDHESDVSRLVREKDDLYRSANVDSKLNWKWRI